jgi:hypothetical protein
MEKLNLSMRNSVLLVALLALAWTACKKDPSNVDVDLGYDYFPNQISKYKEYFVDSTYHGITEENFQFYVREELTESFVDDEGQVSVRVERSKKSTLEAYWVLTDVWTQKRTSTSAQRVEENLRYVRLAFPADLEEQWNGNAYNGLDEWVHRYLEVDVAKQVGAFNFGSTVTVEQRNNVNLVDQELSTEVYAKGVGLVYKSLIDLNFQNFEITGVELEMTLIDHGWIE